MSVYFIANIRIRNEREYEEYIKGSDEAFEGSGGEYLAVDENPGLLEGGWDYSKAVIIRFPDEETLKKWYRSPAYQRILKHRLAAAECDTIIVHGR